MADQVARWPRPGLENVAQDQLEMALHGVQCGPTHVLDLLDDMPPVHMIDALAARETAQRFGLTL